MSEYSEEPAEYFSEEIEISDREESESEVEDVCLGENEILEELQITREQGHRLTDLVKAQQRIIESLRKELTSLKLRNVSHIGNATRKCAPKSEESTSAVVSSFEDDDDELDSLSSEESGRYDDSAEDGVLIRNPLLVDVIIQKVMDHLPLKSLLLARLVCRKWNAMATSQIASKTSPILLEVHQPWKPSKGIRVSTFIDVMRNSLGCPLTKFSISSFVALEELDRFFFHFGRNVKHVDLNFAEEFDDSQAFIQLLIRKIPHLESLRVGCCQMFKQMYLISRPNDPETWPYENKLFMRNLKVFCIGNIVNMIPSKTWLEAFFKMTPNLEKLVLHANFKENGNTFIRIVLESLLNVEILKNIRSIMVSCLTESHLRTLIKLAESGLKLKNFRFQDLCLHLTEINGATLETFLHSQAEHLGRLEIDQSSNFPRIRHFQLPVMKSLKTLSIVSSQRISFGNIIFSVHLPKLERFTLRGFDVFNCNNIFTQSENTSRFASGLWLKSLSLPSKLNIPHFPKVLATVFPNVTDLEMRGVTNECLKEVWEHWPKLEKLKLVVSHFDDNIDSGLTGIPEDVCTELRSDSRLREDIEDHKTTYAITDLKRNEDLHTLEVECRAMWIPCHIITDVTGYYALMHLNNLRKLKVTEIGVPEKFDLSNECIQVIIKALRHADITFKIMDDYGRWQLDLGRTDILRNTYESEPQLEDHNKDREYVTEY